MIPRDKLDLFIHGVQTRLGATASRLAYKGSAGVRIDKAGFVDISILTELIALYNTEEILGEITYDITQTVPYTGTENLSLIYADIIYPLGTLTLVSATQAEVNEAVLALVNASPFSAEITGNILSIFTPGEQIVQYVTLVSSGSLAIASKTVVTEGVRGVTEDTYNYITEAQLNSIANRIEIFINKNIN